MNYFIGLRAVFRKGIILSILVTFLGASAGCGYHLRGVTELDPAYAKVYVQGMSTDDPVYRELRQLFLNTHSALVENPIGATATLVIDGNDVEQRVAVVTPQATVQQYELYQRIDYHIVYADGSETPERHISQARNYNYDPTGVLASTSNEAQIRQELANTLARLLFYRLNAPVPVSSLIEPGDKPRR
ncbi:hypothetical protein A9404_03480 [Halothiobacillus diazotrophicus]|uniref:LPS-assembly lipoprotein LptE n=1 Tax=Halothiobacillus diazotrophicus TaxID=1860122 RepID=A0A191ZFB0_9GAMM|nr:LPS assembly lipoprotein LptE [Halothiobacillus diazotrophicus]ANJ66564.1 hypothetical protein A9404_03480 [Halothiobacillus diazotrophicus]